MLSKTCVPYLVCVATGFVLSNLAQPQLIGQEKAKPSEPPTKWEYKIVPPDQGIEKQFNELGKEGWELNWVDPGSLIFKRPKL